MTEITFTPERIALIYPLRAEIFPLTAAVKIEQGEPVGIDANGKATLADGNVTVAYSDIGVALEGVGIGQTVDVLFRGLVAGFDLDDLDYGDSVYVSDTVGEYADSVGTNFSRIGRVWPMNDPARSKVLFVDGFAGDEGPRGATGATGPQGPAG